MADHETVDRNVPLVLILCTGNSCRSQMAEAFLREAAGDSLEAASAGSQPAGYVHPLAIRAMARAGLDIAHSKSKSLEEFMNREVETVVTVCGNTDDVCPFFPGQRNRYHWAFDDPAIATGSEKEQFEVFLRVRDEIRKVFHAYGLGRRDSLARSLQLNQIDDG